MLWDVSIINIVLNVPWRNAISEQFTLVLPSFTVSPLIMVQLLQHSPFPFFWVCVCVWFFLRFKNSLLRCFYSVCNLEFTLCLSKCLLISPMLCVMLVLSSFDDFVLDFCLRTFILLKNSV